MHIPLPTSSADWRMTWFQLNTLLVLISQIEKMIWPDKLKRFSEDEVIERARKRLNETHYDLLKNNCEHFVTWSMCGLKVSLQVKSWYIWLREAAYSAFAGAYDCIRKKVSDEAIIPFLIKAIANISDECAGFLCRNAQFLGYGIAFLMEAGLACYEISKARNDHVLTSEEYNAKWYDVVLKAGFRFFCGMGGSLFGGWYWGTIAGSLLGGAFGAGLGHILAAGMTWLCENWFYMDG